MTTNGTDGRPVALVTGASRRGNIAAAVARRLAADGYDLLLHGWQAHDDEMPWGAERDGPETVAAECRAAGAGVRVETGDFADPGEPARVVAVTYEAYGRLDALCAVHARSSSYDLAATTAAELDLCFAVNTRSTVLLAQAYAERHDPERAGRLVLFTSGQRYGSMHGEIPYAVSKGANEQMTATLAGALADRGITVNAIDPGPCDTGWADPERYEWVRQRMPGRRWAEPADAAALVAFLLSPDADAVTAQVLASDRGWGKLRDTPD